MKTFQDIIMELQRFWIEQGCAVLQPYDIEMGAGTFHPATALKALGPRPWKAAYAQPCRRPGDGRYGENPNRLGSYHQFQVILKPPPDSIRQLYFDSLAAAGVDAAANDLRLNEDNWESPTLGAAGLGWECLLNGMEVSQFTYFQQVMGLPCAPVAGEITYGLERLAMAVQDADSVFDIMYNETMTYGDLFRQPEQEYSRYSFEHADVETLAAQFRQQQDECRRLLEQGEPAAGEFHKCVLPAYDQCVKASHTFNLLDARGVLSAAERQSHILEVRELAQACGRAFLQTEFCQYESEGDGK